MLFLIIMVNENVKTLLIVTSSGPDTLFPFLFEFTKYWASQGRRLLYISKSKIESLPPSLGEIGKPDSNILKLMQFMYLPKWKDLFYQLATIHVRSFQVCAIIIDNLAQYLKDERGTNFQENHVSHVCASLLYAALLSSKRIGKSVVLICGYVSDDSTIEQTIVKNFFHNIWETKKSIVENDKTMLKITKLSKANHNEVVYFSYVDDNDVAFDKDRSNVKLNLIEIIKKII